MGCFTFEIIIFLSLTGLPIMVVDTHRTEAKVTTRFMKPSDLLFLKMPVTFDGKKMNKLKCYIGLVQVCDLYSTGI